MKLKREGARGRSDARHSPVHVMFLRRDGRDSADGKVKGQGFFTCERQPLTVTALPYAANIALISLLCFASFSFSACRLFSFTSLCFKPFLATATAPHAPNHGAQHAQTPGAHNIHPDPFFRSCSSRLQQANSRPRRRCRLRQLLTIFKASQTIGARVSGRRKRCVFPRFNHKHKYDAPDTSKRRPADRIRPHAIVVAEEVQKAPRETAEARFRA